MSSILRSVRKLMPDAREDVSHHHPAVPSEASSGFQTMDHNNTNSMSSTIKASANKMFRSRTRTSSNGHSIDTYYVEASHNTQGMTTTSSTNKALSPTSPSAANARYQRMDEEGEDEYQVPPSTEPETIQQSFQRVQRRVSDSWRSLQGVSVRRLVGQGATSSSSLSSTTTEPTTATTSTRSKSLSHLLSEKHAAAAAAGEDQNEESRHEVEETSHERRFFNKAVRRFRKSLPRPDEAGSTTTTRSMPSTDGYIRQKGGNNNAVVFAPRKDMVMT